ncbi:MAG TPA: single-stranded DNA-binding protein, partial [Saprospirales bacterium]|nr:single-stranded DNA-binding protein [Saprospirales bacterium]
PTVEGDDLPWAKYWDHFFQGPTGQWYVEKSLTTIQKDDPVSEMNSKLWNTGIEADKDLARKRKRRLHYVSNIYVVADPENPENEGKVFLYGYGAKIFEKIMDSMQPKFQDETPVNPFDLWKGANFKMKIANVAGYRNYDRSEFANAEALNADDSVLEGIYNKQYALSEFTDPTSFKSYSELNLKLTRVLGEEVKTNRTEIDYVDEDIKNESPFNDSPNDVKDPVATAADPVARADSDNDDTMSYFAKLAAEA